MRKSLSPIIKHVVILSLVPCFTFFTAKNISGGRLLPINLAEKFFPGWSWIGANSGPDESLLSDAYQRNSKAKIVANTPVIAFPPKNEALFIAEDSNKFNHLVEDEAPEESFSAREREGRVGTISVDDEDVITDNFFTISIPMQNRLVRAAYLEYDLFGLANHQSVAKSINLNPSIGGMIVVPSYSWSHQKEKINISSLNQGKNSVLFNSSAVGVAYKVKNVKITLSFKEEKNPMDNFYITRVNSDVYLSGFVNGLNEQDITVNGKKIMPLAGSFEDVIEIDTASLLRGTIEVGVNNQRRYLKVGEQVKNGVMVGGVWPTASQIFLDSSKVDYSNYTGISAKVDSLENIPGRLVLNILPLRPKDFPGMSNGIKNVSLNGSAYRLSTNRINSNIQVSIPYDESRLAGKDPKEIKIYYFDYTAKKWMLVAGSKVHPENKTVSFRVAGDHDYINGIINVPETPQLNAFAPTSISGLKAGDPYAGVQMIAPPAANQMGSANLFYPITIPSGTAGLAPNLSISYNSNGGNGWLGEGWNISGLPAISLDTRWGSPAFDPQVETELYSLDGEMLVYDGNYLPHRHNNISENSDVYTTDKQDRSDKFDGTKKKFFLRKNHDFSIIERYGADTRSYRWIVTNSNGTKMYFGGNESGVDDQSVIHDANGNIVHWGITKIVDVHDNNIQFEYDNIEISGLGGENANLNEGKYFNIKKIAYTGHGNSMGLNTVEFEREASISRSDIRMSANNGVKLVEPFRLLRINVRYDGNLIRYYTLQYSQGEYGKTLLASISEKDAADVPTNKYKLEYFNDVSIKGVGTTSTDFSSDQLIQDNFNAGAFRGIPSFLRPAKISANSVVDWSSHFRPGVGLAFLGKKKTDPDKNIMAALDLGISGSSAKTAQQLVDFNGDGILDMIYRKSGDGLYVRPGNLQTGVLSFGTAIKIQNLSSNFSLSNSKGESIGYDFGIKFFKRLGLNYSYSKNVLKTFAPVYMLDANSDGIMDVAKDGQVLFGKVDNGAISMSPFSENSENMVIVAKDMDKFTPPGYESLSKNDVVKVWVAPRAGNINFKDWIAVPKNATGTYSVEMRDPSNPSVNCRIALFKLGPGMSENLNIGHYNDYFAQIQSVAPNNSGYLGSNSPAPLHVEAGDKVFVRLHSQEGKNFEMRSDPEITYTDIDDAGLQLYKQDGFRISPGKYSENFLLNNHSTPFLINTPGQVSINLSHLDFPNTQDEITYEVEKENLNDNTSSILFTDTRPENNTGPVNFPTQLLTFNVSAAEVPCALKVRVKSDSHSDFGSNTPFSSAGFGNPAGISAPGYSGNPHLNLVLEFPSNLVLSIKPQIALSHFIPNPPGGSHTYFVSIDKNIAASAFGNAEGSFMYIVKRNGHVIGKRRMTFVQNTGLVEQDIVTGQTVNGNSPLNLYAGSNTNGVKFNIQVYFNTQDDQNFYEAYKMATGMQPFKILMDNQVLESVEETSINSAAYGNIGQFYNNWGQFVYNELADVIPSASGDDYVLNPATPSDEIGRLINISAFKAQAMPSAKRYVKLLFSPN